MMYDIYTVGSWSFLVVSNTNVMRGYVLISGTDSDVLGVLSATSNMNRDNENKTVSCTDIFSSILSGGIRNPTIQIIDRTIQGITMLNTCCIVCLRMWIYTCRYINIHSNKQYYLLIDDVTQLPTVHYF